MSIRLPLRSAQYTPDWMRAACIRFHIYDVKRTWKVSFWLDPWPEPSYLWSLSRAAGEGVKYPPTGCFGEGVRKLWSWNGLQDWFVWKSA